MTVKIFDGLSERFGNGSVERMSLRGSPPISVLRITLKISDVRRMFFVALNELNGEKNAEVIELDPRDGESPVTVDDDVRFRIEETVKNVMLDADV